MTIMFISKDLTLVDVYSHTLEMALAGQLNYIEVVYIKGCLPFLVLTSVSISGVRTKEVSGAEGRR